MQDRLSLKSCNACFLFVLFFFVLLFLFWVIFWAFAKLLLNHVYFLKKILFSLSGMKIIGL